MDFHSSQSFYAWPPDHDHGNETEILIWTESGDDVENGASALKYKHKIYDLISWTKLNVKTLTPVKYGGKTL